MSRLTLAVAIVLIASLRGAPSGAVTTGDARSSVHAPIIVGAESGSMSAPTSIRGTASWYCHDGRFRGAPRSRCTRGVPASTMAVAVPWKLRSQFPRGTRVRLCRASRCVSATVRDVNVGPSWDCYAVVFNALAPLSRGRITVIVRAVP